MNIRFIDKVIRDKNTDNPLKTNKKTNKQPNRSLSPNNRNNVNSNKNNINKQNDNYLERLCEEEYEKLDKINKLESALLDLKLSKIIFRKNFHHLLKNILTSKKRKINLIKIYSFMLRNKFNEFLINLKRKIYAYSLKKISYTYLYSVSIRNCISKFLRHVKKKNFQKKVSFNEQKLFYRKLAKKFIFNSFEAINKKKSKNSNINNTNKDLDSSNDYAIKFSMDKIKNFIEKKLDLKNNLCNYFDYNPFNADADNDYDFHKKEFFHRLDFSEIEIEHRKFKKQKKLIMKKILFENLVMNKTINESILSFLTSKHNTIIVNNVLVNNARLALYRMHQVADCNSEFNLLKKQNIFFQVLKTLIRNKANKRRNLDFLISNIRFKKKAAIKYFFTFIFKVINNKTKQIAKLKNAKRDYFKRLIWLKIKVILNKTQESKKQLALINKGKMKTALNLLLKNNLFKKQYKKNVEFLFKKIEKLFIREAYAKIHIFPSILKTIKHEQKKKFFFKLFFLKIQYFLRIQKTKFYFKVLQHSNSAVVCIIKKHSFTNLLSKVKLQRKEKQNKRMAFFYYKRKSKFKLFYKLKNIFESLREQKNKYIIALLNFRRNYIKKAFSGLKVNCIVAKQKNQIYKNLLQERSYALKAYLLNKILCRVSTSMALSKDAFQARYFEIIKKLKNEKYSFDNYLTRDENENNDLDNKKQIVNKLRDFTFESNNKTNQYSQRNLGVIVSAEKNLDKSNSYNNKFSENIKDDSNLNRLYFNKTLLSETDKLMTYKKNEDLMMSINKETNNQNTKNFNSLIPNNNYNNTIDKSNTNRFNFSNNHYQETNRIEGFDYLEGLNYKKEDKILENNQHHNNNNYNNNLVKQEGKEFNSISNNKIQTKVISNRINDDIKLLMEMRNKKKNDPIIN